MRKRIFCLIILILFCGMSLTACTPLFDMLNFNRDPLPNIESIPDEGLINNYQKQEDIYSKSEFEALALDSVTALSERTVFEEVLRISYSFLDQYGSTYGNEYTSTLTHLDREEAEEEGKPYARFHQKNDTYTSYQQSEVFFFEDRFVAAPQEYGYTYAFLRDEYLDDMPVMPLVHLENGGFLSGLISLIDDNFVSSYSDFNNGHRVVMIRLKDDATDLLKEFLPSTFSKPDNFGELDGISHAQISLEGDNISSVSVRLVYEQGSVLFECRNADDFTPFEFYSNGIATVPSYYYHFLNLSAGYISNSGNFNMFNKELQVDVSLSGSNYEGQKEGSSISLANEFTLYNVENTIYNNMYPYYSNKEYVKLLVMGENRIYSNLGWFFSEKNGVVTQHGFESNDSMLNDCNNLFNELYWLFSDYFNASWVPSSVTLTKTDDGYVLVLEEILGFGYDEHDVEVVHHTRSLTYEISDDFTTINSLVFCEVYFEQILAKVEMTLTHDFEITIPTKVLDFGVKF